MASGRLETRLWQRAPFLMKKAMMIRLNLAQMKTMAGSADGGFGAQRLYENDESNLTNKNPKVSVSFMYHLNMYSQPV